MTFKKFRNGVCGIDENLKVKIPFKTTLFLLLVWTFYAKWVYMYRSIKERKNNDDDKREE